VILYFLEFKGVNELPKVKNIELLLELFFQRRLQRIA
jgi:hypothetical protein